MKKNTKHILGAAVMAVSTSICFGICVAVNGGVGACFGSLAFFSGVGVFACVATMDIE